MPKTLRVVVVLALVLATAGMASADVTGWLPSPPTTYTNVVDWPLGVALALPKFDVTLGTLTQVDWKLDGLVGGTVLFENKSGSETTAYGSLAADITLSLPGGGALATVSPSRGFGPVTVGAYGTYVWPSLFSDWVTATGSFTTGLDDFKGPGTVSLPAMATGKSEGHAGGTVTWTFVTGAQAQAQVRYHYTTDTETTPELPSSALLLLGALPVAFAWRRRKTA
jgi:hypothetical protein